MQGFLCMMLSAWVTGHCDMTLVRREEPTQCSTPSKDLVAQDPCPVNGGWSDWSSWTTCSMTCGTGMTSRHRNCTNPEPSRLGVPCPGDSKDYNLCTNNLPCPMNGFWAEWSPWYCYIRAQGKRVRERDCYQPLFGGQNTCVGNSTELKDDPSCHI